MRCHLRYIGLTFVLCHMRGRNLSGTHQQNPLTNKDAPVPFSERTVRKNRKSPAP